MTRAGLVSRKPCAPSKHEILDPQSGVQRRREPSTSSALDVFGYRGDGHRDRASARHQTLKWPHTGQLLGTLGEQNSNCKQQLPRALDLMLASAAATQITNCVSDSRERPKARLGQAIRNPRVVKDFVGRARVVRRSFSLPGNVVEPPGGVGHLA